MFRLALLGLPIALAASGCVVYDDPDPDVVVVQKNHSPVLVDGSAWVYYDAGLRDDIWTFDSVVDDPDGFRDIIGVWADVYDEWSGGVPVESFELFPTNDPAYWFSDWYGSTTRLDPFYRGYTVDLVVYDTYEEFDWITVWAETY